MFTTLNHVNRIVGTIAMFVLLFFAVTCEQMEWNPSGKYTLELSGMKSVSEGQLDIVGEPGDYFGKLVLQGNRIRTFSVGLVSDHIDTLNFRLPGGGYLNLVRRDTVWRGNFKYFGLAAEVTAIKDGEIDPDMESLVDLKPLGKGIISTELEESFPAFDSQNYTLYFTRDNQILSCSFEGSTGWQTPIPVSFSGSDEDSAPFISEDGTTLLFSSNRKVSEEAPKKKNLWTSQQSEYGWGEPKLLPSPINIDSLGDYHGAKTRSGAYYFVSYNREGGYGRSDIYKACPSDEGDYQITNLGPQINTQLSEADVFVDPEEKFLLFATTDRADGFGADDIYFSSREAEGWTTPVNLGPKVNSFAYEYGAWVDSKNGFLYFNSFRRGSSDIYRISLDQIEVLEPLLNHYKQ